MGRISTYNQDSTLTGADKVLGTDASGSITRNYSLESIVEFFNDAGLLSIFDGVLYEFKDYDSSSLHPEGIINVSQGSANNTAFSAITILYISNRDKTKQALNSYLDALEDKHVRLTEVDNLNNFGIYSVTAVEDTTDNKYKKLTLQLRNSNGTFTKDKAYFVSNYSATYDVNLGNRSVTDLSDVTDAGSGEIITDTERTNFQEIYDNGLRHSDVVDNLTSTSDDTPLSANQGRVLKGLIDAINTLLTSDNTDLDTLQEVVDFIEANKDSLDNLSISNIAGLQSALDGKQATEAGKGLSTEDFTSALKTKLEGIEAGGEVNVQPNWNETNTGSDAFIQNKPTDITDLTSHNVTELTDVFDAGSGYIITDSERTKLQGIETSADVTDTTNVVAALTAGTNVTIASDGTINAADTTYSAGTGLDLTSTTFSVDVSDFMTNGANDRLVTATGADGLNAEADLTFDGTHLYVPNRIVRAGDTNTFISFLDDYVAISAGGRRIITFERAETVINDFGDAHDFRVESDNDRWMLYVEGATDRVGIGTDNPSTTLDVDGTVTATAFSGDGSGLTGISDTQLSNEEVQDIVGGMVTGNSVSGITVTYQDDDGTLDFSVASQTDENFTTALKTKLDGIETSANNYSLPEATATTRGGIELFSNTDQSVAANSVSSTAGRTYGIQLNSDGQAVVNVPWTDTDTNTDTDVSVANLKTRLSQISDNTTIGDADDVDITFAGGVTISGDLTVSGTTTQIDTNTLNIGDNIITLNNDESGTPSQNAGIEVERGTSTNVSLRWNETTDKWQYTNDGSTYTDLGASAETADNAEAVHIAVKNTSGATIAKGTPVYITGNVGNSDRLEIAKADASDSAKMPAIGLLESELTNNGEGYVAQGGYLKGLATSTIDGTSMSSNDTIYVKAGGGLTATKPTGSNLIQNIAKVARVHASNGSVIVSSILRTNDVPNLSTGKIWVGDGNTIESTTVHIDETNGRLGINTTAPTQRLHIFSAGYPQMALQSNGGTWRMGVSSGNDLVFARGTSGSNYPLWLDSSDNIGIGTNSPDSKLHISGISQTGSLTAFKIENDTNNDKFLIRSILGDYNLQFKNAGNVVKVLLNSNGDSYLNGGSVGIGVTSPDRKLHVNSGTGNYVALFESDDNRATIVLSDNDTNAYWHTQNNFTQIGVTDGISTQNLSIDSSGNVGIGTGGSGINRELTIGDGTGSPNIQLLASNAGSSRIEFGDSDDTDAGEIQYVHSSDYMQFTTNGAQRMRITSDGKVGIGTQSPNHLLDIEKEDASARLFNLTSDGNTDLFLSTTGTTGASRILFGDTADNDAGRIIYRNSGDSMAFETAANEAMRIDSDGNVGIGTGSGVSANLDVASTSGTSLQVRNTGTASSIVISNDANDNSIYSRGANSSTARNLRFFQGSNVAMVIDSDSNVGIGTDNPAFAGGSGMEIERAGIATIRLQDTSNAANAELQSGEYGLHIRVGANGSTGDLFNVSSAGSSRLLIDSSGNVGIGETNPSQALHLKTVGEAAIRLQDDDGTNQFVDLAHNNGSSYIVSRNGSSHGNFIIYTSNGSSTSERLRINSSGNVGIGTGSSITGKFNSYISATRQLTHNGNGGDLSIISDNNSAPVMYIKGTGTADLLQVFDNTNQVFTIKDGGTVGIGPTSPTRALHIGKNSASSIITLQRTNANTTGAYGALHWSNSSDHSVATIDVRGDGDNLGGEITFRTTGSASANDPYNLTEAMRIDSSGNVGINATNPLSKLQVGSGTTNTGSNIAMFGGTENGILSALSLVNTAGNSAAGRGTALDFHVNSGYSPTGRIATLAESTSTPAALAFYTYNTSSDPLTERMRIDSSGRILIGVTDGAGTTKLTVGDSVNPRLEITPITDALQIEVLNDARSLAKPLKIYAEETIFHSRNHPSAYAEAMRINSDGRVLIGDDTAFDTNAITMSPNGQVFANNLALANGAGSVGGTSPHIYSPASGELGISSLSSEHLRIDSSGNVGIGTTSPDAELEVVGKQMITVGSSTAPHTDDYLYIGGSDLASSNASIYIGNAGDGSGYGWRILYEGTGSGNNNKLKFKSENLGSEVEAITILQDGNVGIGANSPDAKLEVDGNLRLSTSDDKLQFANNNVGIYREAGNILALGGYGGIYFNAEGVSGMQNQSTRMVIADTGDVGINETSPDTKLHVVKGGSGEQIVAIFENSTNASATKSSIQLRNATNDVCSTKIISHRRGANFGADLVFELSDGVDGSFQERMRITESGDVGIGGIINPSAKLHVKDGFTLAASTENVLIENTTTGQPSALAFTAVADNGGAGNEGAIYFDAGADGTASNNLIAFNADHQTDNNYDMVIRGDGRVGIGTDTPRSPLTVVSAEDQMLTLEASDDGPVYMAFNRGADRHAYFGFGSSGDSLRLINEESTGKIQIGTNGSYSLTIDSDGNVGINNTNPSARLHVDGVIVSEGGSYTSGTDTNGDVGLVITKGDYIKSDDNHYLRNIIGHAANSNIEIGQGGTALISDIILTAGSSGNTIFRNSGSEDMRINSSGNVGIGTGSSVDANLHVKTAASLPVINLETTHSSGIPVYNMKGAASGQVRYQDENGNNQTRIDFLDAGAMSFIDAANGNTRMAINSSGDVGIGTTSPSDKLHVSGGDIRIDGGSRHLLVDHGSGSGSVGVILQSTGANLPFLRWYDGTNNLAGMRTSSSGTFTIQTNGFNDRLTIDSTGVITLNTTDVRIAEYLYHSGDTNTFIRFTTDAIRFDAGGRRFLDFTEGSADIITFNEGGVDMDFRIKSNNNNNMLFVDGGNNRVGIGTSTPSAILDVKGPDLGSTSGDTVLHAVIQGTRHHLDFEEERTANTSDWGNTTYRLGMRVDSTNHQSIDFVSDASSLEHIDIRTGNRNFHSRFTYDGKLGIGTTSPSATLDVDGTYILNGQKGLKVRSIDETNYYSFNDNSTAGDFEQQLPQSGGSGSVAKVDDSTAPAVGCFEITGNYYADGGDYIKIDINAEYTFEMYVKYVSGSDTGQRIYAGWTMYNSSKTSFGNVQRYWGAGAVEVDANSNNSDWVLLRGTISGVGSSNGQFISGTEYAKPVLLMNYNDNANVIRICGLRLYKSSQNLSKLQLGRSTSSSVISVDTEYPEAKVTLENNATDGLRVRNDHGYIEIGPLNDSHAHLQTDRPNFYFNKHVTVDTGIISSYNENLQLRAGQSSTTAITVLQSNGNVGIGTTSPAAPLTIANATGGSWNDGLIIDDPSGWAATIYKRSNSEKMYTGLYSGNDNYIWMATPYSNSGTTITAPRADAVLMARPATDDLQIYLDTHFGGNVGIGTDSPDAPLHIDGGSTNQALIVESNSDPYIAWRENGSRKGYIQYTGTYTYIVNEGTGSIRFRTVNNNDKLTINTSELCVNDAGADYNFRVESDTNTHALFVDGGNSRVGIGTGTPRSPLTVVSAEDQMLTLEASDNGPVYMAFNRGSDRHAYFGFGSSSDNFRLINEESAGDIGIGTNGSVSLTIDSDGDVGIGTTTPLQRFHTAGVAYFSGGTNVAFESGGDVQTNTAIVIDKGDKIKVRSGQYLRDLLHQDSNSLIKVGSTGTSLISGINLEPGHDGSTGAAQVKVYGGTTEYVRFDGYNKRVGIGRQSNIGANLVVQNSSGTAIPSLGSSGGHFQLQNGTYGLSAGVTATGASWMQSSRTDGTATAYNLVLQPNGGNVGIRTTSPDAKLHILAGDNTDAIKIEANSGINSYKNIIFKPYVTQAQAASFVDGSHIYTTSPGGGTTWPFTEYGALVIEGRDNTNSGIAFRTGGGSGQATRLAIRENGKIGIGETDPSAPLHIDGGSTNQVLIVESDSNPYIRFRENGTTLGYLQGRSAGEIRLHNGSSSYFDLVNTHLDINTSSGYLEIGPKNTSFSHFYTDRPQYFFNKKITVDGGIISSFDENLQLKAGYNSTVAITVLESNGNVGIGTTSPGEKLEVAGEVKASGGFSYATGSTAPARESGTDGLQFWSGTKAQYDALTKDDDTIYYITDE